MSVVANVAINVDAGSAAKELNKVDRAAGELNQSFSGLQAAVAALGLGVAIKSIADVGQKSEQTKNQLRALTAQYGELEVATSSIDRIQKMLGISTLDAREGYSQLYAALRGTGASVEQLEVLFVGLTNAARLSGAGAAEAQGALLQLKQAFASGTLSGDELRSVLEAMPAFTQQLAKETDRLGLTTKATSADIKKLGSEGKITSDILFAAAKTLATSNAPNITTAEQLGVAFTNLRETLAETFGPSVIGGAKVFGAAVTALGNWFKTNQAPIQKVASTLLGLLKALGPGAAAVLVVVKAYQAWTTVSKALAATQAFLMALGGPKGIALVGAAAVAAGLAYAGLNQVLAGTDAELKAQTKEATQAQAQFKNMASTVEPIPPKIKEATTAMALFGSAAEQTLSMLKQQKLGIDGQISALERGGTLTAKRYEAALAINDLEQQRLQRSYEQAKTEQQRLTIATQLFRTQLQAAKIEYNQALETIKLEQQKVNLRLQLERLKLKEIAAEADLQKLKASETKDSDKRLEKEAEIDKKKASALASQQNVVDEVQRQIPAQKEIAEYEKQIAAAKFESQKLTAQTAYEQKLTTAEIGMSEQASVRLSNAIANNYRLTSGLKNEYTQVAGQIERAVVAQQRLNAAKGGGVVSETQYKYNDGSTGYAYIKAHYAKGGFVTKPTAAMVGEGGEPEYVIPSSKMNAAMARYASGKRGESVIPQAAGDTSGSTERTAPMALQTASDTSGSSDYAPSINPMINVTTGPVMNMNGSNYVSQRDFIAGMQAASRRGAEMALSAMRNNGTVRRVVGAR